MDLLERDADDLPISIEAFTNLDDLRSLLAPQSDVPGFSARFAKLSEGLCEVVEDFGLLSLTPLSVQDRESVANVLSLIDRANGYEMSGLRGRNPYANSATPGAGVSGLASSSVWEGAPPQS